MILRSARRPNGGRVIMRAPIALCAESTFSVFARIRCRTCLRAPPPRLLFVLMLSFMLCAAPVYGFEATRTSQLWPHREITFFCWGNFHCWSSTYHYNIFQFFELIEICKKLSESKFGVFASMRATTTKRLAFRVRRLLCALLSRSVVRRFDARYVCG